MPGRTEGPRNPDILKVPTDGYFGNGMDLVAGSWCGKNENFVVEEMWTKVRDKEWFGVRKIDESGNIRFQLFSFRFQGPYTLGYMRHFKNDLEEASDKIARETIKTVDNSIKGKVVLILADGSTINYQVGDASTLKVSGCGTDGQIIELKRQ
jgi:hypothetical protein